MKRSPHILVINVYFAPNRYGGATVLAENVARTLMRRHGARITAISAVCRNDLAPYAVVKTHVDGIDSYLVNLPGARSFEESFLNPEVDDVISRLAAQLSPDLAHVHCLQDLGVGFVAALKAQGIPVVLSTHDYWWLCERQFMMTRAGNPCGLARASQSACRDCVRDKDLAAKRHAAVFAAGALADIVTCPSRYSLRLHMRSGFATGRLRLWENGVIPPASDIRRKPRDRTTFGYFGGPSDMKGWPLLKAAFRGLKGEFDVVVADASLDGSWWTDENLASLPGNWRVLPRYRPDQLDEIFAQIDVLLFPSQWAETFGLVIREALGRGVRVIQSDAGGSTEHQGDALSKILPQSAPASAWRGAIEAAMGVPPCPEIPAAVRSVDQQADAFLEMVAPLLAKRLLRAEA